MMLALYVAEKLAANRAAEVEAMVRQNWLLRALRQSQAKPAPAAGGPCCQTCTCAAA